MKKLLTVLLATALLAGTLAIPALAESKLLSWNGFEIWATDYSYRDSENGYTFIHMDVHILNNTDRTISVMLRDVQIDGTPIYGAAFSGITPGADKTDWILFKPSDDNVSGGDGAIRTGSQIDMTMTVRDSDTYEKLYSQDVSINLYDLSAGGDYVNYDDEGLDFGHGGNSASTAPAYTPASTNYQTLKKGSKGQAVRDLQQRLTNLGYLNDKVDGSYGRNTNTAVRSFCEQHGLPIGNQATPEMQALLYSSNAQYYVEPYLPLVIGETYKQETPRQTGISDTGMLNILLVNRSSTRGIRGFVLRYYQTNMYGDKIDLTDGRGVYQFDQEQMNYIEPGHYKDGFTYSISKYYSTYAVYVGVKKIVFDDGEVRELADSDVVFYECAISR